MQILKYKIFYKIIVSFIILFNIIFISSIAYANATSSPLNLKDAFRFNDGSNSDPTDFAAKNAGYNTGADNNLLAIISTVIQVALSLLGVIFLILIIYAGINWMTAGGEEEKVTKAKGTLTNAVIGLVVVLAAYAISYFVVYNISSTVLK